MIGARTAAVLAGVVLWVTLAAHALASIEVRATIDRSRVHVGEQVVMALQVSGARGADAPALDDVPGFTARYVGPSTQVEIVGGQMTQSVSHRYVLVAQEAGTHTLGPFTISVGGKTYRTAPVQVEVLAQAPSGRQRHRARQPAEGSDLELLLEVSSTDLYLHQRLPITLTLYVGATRIDDVEYPALSGDAFAIEPFGKPAQRRVRRGGQLVQEVTFRTSIIPLRSGEVALGPAVQSMTVLVSRRGRNRGFRQFFGADIFAERQVRELHSNEVLLNVRPLPARGRPADFSGAVGQFDLEVTAQPTEVDVNDPVTLTTHISGEGNLTGFTPPSLAAPGFKVYPARSLKSEENAGTRVIEQVLIPSSEDVHELPVVRFSYFDPQAGAYRIVSRGPIPLVVRARQGPTGAAARKAPGRRRRRAEAAPEELGRDIVYVKDTPGRMQRGAPVYFRTWFLVAQCLPLAAYLMALFVARRYRRLEGDPGYARFARAAREARKAIAAVRRTAVAGDALVVYDGLARAVREYLSAKLDLPVGAVDIEHVAGRLRATAPDVVEQVREFLALVERMRYAPEADGDHDRRALDLAEQIVRGLERKGGLAARFDPGRYAAVLGLALAGVTAVTAVADVERDPMTTFFESNAQYKAGRYAEAAAGYARLVDAGFQSAALYYNLGNALFKDGAVGGAVLNYERARRLSPRDPDVRANLQFARERVGADNQAMALESPLWLRVLVPLAFRASTTELVVATSVMYTLLMVILGIRLFVPRVRQVCGRAAVAIGVLLALVASAAGLRLVEDHVRTMAVVTRTGTISVRFEPSANGTVHFALPEGAVVRELARRDGWRQVARGDGRRGWVEATAVDTL